MKLTYAEGISQSWKKVKFYTSGLLNKMFAAEIWILNKGNKGITEGRGIVEMTYIGLLKIFAFS